MTISPTTGVSSSPPSGGGGAPTGPAGGDLSGTYPNPSVAVLTNAALTNAHILVGNGSNIAKDVALSGDATMANTGALTITSIGSTTPVQAQEYAPINAQTGTTYTLVLGDNGKWVTLSNASAITMTVPTNASVAFPVNAEVMLSQIGAGSATIAAAGGVTINKLSTLVFSGQYGVAGLKKIATDTWIAFGALA